MRNILTALVFATSMILIALGVSYGQIDRDAGTWLLIVIPAIAVSLMMRSKGQASNAKGCC